MTEVMVRLLYAGAKNCWPELTSAAFNEAAQSVLDRTPANRHLSLSDMSLLLEQELTVRYGKPRQSEAQE